MLEGYTGERGPRARRRLGPAAIVSIAAHIGVLVALLLAASWRIDKLTFAGPTIYLAGPGSPTPDPGEGAARPTPPERPHVVKRTRRVTELAQPEPAPPVEVAEPVAIRDEGRVAEPSGAGLNLLGNCVEGAECIPAGLLAIEQAPVCGNGKVEPGEQCDDGGHINNDGCSARCTTERTVVVDPRIIEGYRVAGEPQIHPPDKVRDRMQDRGEMRAVGIVKMCLGTDGVPSSLQIHRTTGYKDYDDLLLARMRAWRYRPYQLADGTPVTACTLVAFIYRLEVRPIRRGGLR
jgi:cysteine-rich repeat protein